jgi:hypothetical protein
LLFAGTSCGWRWAAEVLVDRVVWPAHQQLQAVKSQTGPCVRETVEHVIRSLLKYISDCSRAHPDALEFVGSVEEALQFLT